MRIAILSDTHGRHALVARALHMVKAREVQMVLHCGDIDDPDTVFLFDGLTVHFVFGNGDRNDQAALCRAIAQIGAAWHDGWGQLELEGTKIAFLHGDDAHLLHDLEHSGAFDFLFHGHTHQAEEHQTGPTRVVNPGALHRAWRKTFALLDLSTKEVELVTVY